MAFSDPVSMNTVASFTNGAALSWDRLKDGQYLLTSSTLDEPIFLQLDNTLNPAGQSSFVAKYLRSKNAPGTVPYGDKPQPDDILQVHTVIRWTHRSFTSTDVDTAVKALCGFLLNDTLRAKFISGQR